MPILIEEPTLYENILNYALYAGALFQLICIFAAVFLPYSDSEKEREAASKVQMTGPSSSIQSKHQDSSHRRGKREKKKHR